MMIAHRHHAEDQRAAQLDAAHPKLLRILFRTPAQSEQTW
jgi:hypothetical protein